MIRAWQYREGVEKIDVPFDPLPPIDPSALLWIDCDRPTEAGMNFQNAPSVGWKLGFLVVGLVDVALSIPLYPYFKRKNWI